MAVRRRERKGGRARCCGRLLLAAVSRASGRFLPASCPSLNSHLPRHPLATPLSQTFPNSTSDTFWSSAGFNLAALASSDFVRGMVQAGETATGPWRSAFVTGRPTSPPSSSEARQDTSQEQSAGPRLGALACSSLTCPRLSFSCRCRPLPSTSPRASRPFSATLSSSRVRTPPAFFVP